VEYIGVLVITVFYMMKAIVKFVIIFTFISIGFSAAFHMLYDNNPLYSNFSYSNIYTFVGLFSNGYEIPEYSTLLLLPNSIVGYWVQLLCLVIGIVMLLNFLIAMMNSIYNNFQLNSKLEYRWIMTRNITLLQFSPWPVPFNLIQLVIGGLYCCFRPGYIGLNPIDKTEEEKKKENAESELNSNIRQKLYAHMAISYFRETLKDSEYRESLLFDSPPIYNNQIDVVQALKVISHTVEEYKEILGKQNISIQVRGAPPHLPEMGEFGDVLVFVD
jgi:hypothetical protein